MYLKLVVVYFRVRAHSDVLLSVSLSPVEAFFYLIILQGK